jgi:hypothetical protein
MPNLIGSISRWGPTINVKVMQTNQRVEALKKAAQKFSSPMVVLGLIDTGASLSVLDSTIVDSLGLVPKDIVSVHTPTTGSAYEKRRSYDALFIVGETTGDPFSKTIQIIECDLASEGIYALIGRNFLDACQFIYDGPKKSFTLQYDLP